MSLNNRFGSTRNLDHLGKFYNSIDFEYNISKLPNKEAWLLGDLIIGNRKTSLTVSECNKLIETLTDAVSNIHKTKSLGLIENFRK
jgi:hypothetical protein